MRHYLTYAANVYPTLFIPTTQVLKQFTSKAARSYLLSFFVLAFVLAGCKSAEPVATSAEAPEMMQVAAPVAGFTAISDSLQPDSAVEAMIAPFRERLAAGISEEIGETTVHLQKGGLESGLGNMAADAMLSVANSIAATPVHMALTNNGGLRVSIAKGPITVGEIYELMPFENMMTVLELSSVQVDSLAQQLAAARGEPIAGFSFTIDEPTRTAHDIMIGDAPLAADSTYRLVTSDYLANGGGRIAAIWQPLGREDLSMLLRDAFIEYIREKGTISPEVEGRIRYREP